MLDSGDTGGRSRQACIALAEGCPASAVHREVGHILTMPLSGNFNDNIY